MNPFLTSVYTLITSSLALDEYILCHDERRFIGIPKSSDEQVSDFVHAEQACWKSLNRKFQPVPWWEYEQKSPPSIALVPTLGELPPHEVHLYFQSSIPDQLAGALWTKNDMKFEVNQNPANVPMLVPMESIQNPDSAPMFLLCEDLEFSEINKGAYIAVDYSTRNERPEGNQRMNELCQHQLNANFHVWEREIETAADGKEIKSKTDPQRIYLGSSAVPVRTGDTVRLFYLQGGVPQSRPFQVKHGVPVYHIKMIKDAGTIIGFRK